MFATASACKETSTIARCACGWEKEVRDNLAGKKVKCPRCKEPLTLTEATDADASWPPPAPEFEDRPPTRSAVGAAADEAKVDVLDSAGDDRCRIEVIAYRSLNGCTDVAAAPATYYLNRSGIRFKQIRIVLDRSKITLEAGALHYMHGHLKMEKATGGMAGLGKSLLNRTLTSEAAFRPRYEGSGTLYLEPSFGHFILHEMDEDLIVDKGMFYCCSSTVQVEVAAQKNISSALFGGEGWFQTRLSGRGLCALQSPVPADEIRCVTLAGETLQVDGNFALMRTGGVRFSVQKSSRGLIDTFAGGEGLLQTFEGSGRVWLAPTQSFYQAIAGGGAARFAEPTHQRSTKT